MKQLLFISFVFIHLMSQAQISVTNETEEPIYFVYCFYSKSKSFSGWTSKGWYKIIPGETQVIGSFLGEGDNTYYYYAKNESNTHSWGGDYKIAVDEKSAFEIVNADKEYVLDENKGIKQYGFKKKQVFIGILDPYKCTLIFE